MFCPKRFVGNLRVKKHFGLALDVTHAIAPDAFTTLGMEHARDLHVIPARKRPPPRTTPNANACLIHNVCVIM